MKNLWTKVIGPTVILTVFYGVILGVLAAIHTWGSEVMYGWDAWTRYIFTIITYFLVVVATGIYMSSLGNIARTSNTGCDPS